MTHDRIVLILIAFYAAAGLLVRMLVFKGSRMNGETGERAVYLANTAGILWPLFLVVCIRGVKK